MFTTASYDFYCYGNDASGGLSVGGKSFNNTSWSVTVAPGGGEPLSIGAWHTVMISMNGNSAASPRTSTMKIWVDGTEVYNGAVTNTYARRPMAWQGNAWVGTGDAYDGLDCYLSYVWCKEEYLDPATYWSSFFDGSNKPKDIGADGSGVTGSQPDTYVPDGDFTNNLGFGPNWTEVGTVPAAPSSPTD